MQELRGLKGNMGEGAELARGGVKKYREIRGGMNESLCESTWVRSIKNSCT